MKSLAVIQSERGFIVNLLETPFFQRVSTTIGTVEIPYNLKEIEPIGLESLRKEKPALNDPIALIPTVEKCVSLFGQYINTRVIIRFLGNPSYAFKKICLAKNGIEACQTFLQNKNIEQLQRTIRTLHRDAAKLQGRKDKELSPLPYGNFGKIMNVVLSILDRQTLLQYKEDDKKIEEEERAEFRKQQEMRYYESDPYNPLFGTSFS